MGDFDACRFDFRIDGKNGLTPSKRKRGFKRNVYNTLFKCKVCGSLFENRPALLAHKTLHNEHQCTFCDTKFKKKNQLREHVNVVHYIDKLKAGYKSEYGRSSGSSNNSSHKLVSSSLLNNSAMSAGLPPLIPVSDLDLAPGESPNVDHRAVETNFKFGTDAMATSSPLSGSHSLLRNDVNDKSQIEQIMDLPMMSMTAGHDEDESSILNCHDDHKSPSKFPVFPFQGTNEHLNFNQSGSFPQSVLQTAMQSFYPFNQGVMMPNKEDDMNKDQKESKENLILDSSSPRGKMVEVPLLQSSVLSTNDHQYPLSRKSSAIPESAIEVSTNLPSVISPKSPTLLNVSATMPVPPLVRPSEGSQGQLKMMTGEQISGTSSGATSHATNTNNRAQSMSNINLGQLLTTPPIPDLSMLTSIASNKLNISSANPMSLLPKFPTAASFPILSTVGPAARTAISDQAVTSITPSSLKTVMAAPLPTSVKQSLPAMVPKPNGLPQNPFKPITSGSSSGPNKPSTSSSKPSQQAATSQVSLLKCSSLPPVAPIAPPPNIFLTSSSAVSSTSSTATLGKSMNQQEPATEALISTTTPKMATLPLTSQNRPLVPAVTSSLSSTGISKFPVSPKQPQTPVPTPSPNVISPSKPLPSPASLANYLTGIPLQAGVPGGLPTMPGNVPPTMQNLPPGYMMMTLVLTTQPGGGMAAVPMMPGYTYPSMTPKTTTQTPSSGTSGPPTIPVSSHTTQCAVPPMQPVCSSLSNSTTRSQISTTMPGFPVLNPQTQVKPSIEIEPGEITKSHHIPTTLMIPQQHIEKTEKMNNPTAENRYFLNLAHADPDVKPLASHSDISMTMDARDVTKSRESMQMDISQGSINGSAFSSSNNNNNDNKTLTSSQHQQQALSLNNNTKSNKRKQSFPAKNTQAKKQQTFEEDVDGFDTDSDIDEEQIKNVDRPALDLSAKVVTSPEDSDLAAMLDQYNNQEDQENEEKMMMVDCEEKEKFPCVTSRCNSISDTPGDKYPCDQCGFVCENVYMLNKHRAKVHTVKKGLTKMVDRLWKYKKDHKSTSDEILTKDTVEDLPTNMSVEMTNNPVQQSLFTPSSDLFRPIPPPQNNNNNSNNNSYVSSTSSYNDQPSTPIADPEDMISDAAKQVYIQMMNTGLKMLEDGGEPLPSSISSSSTSSIPSLPVLGPPPQMPTVISPQSSGGGPIKVSECETGSGTFGHYRIKKPRFDDYCTFKFHTCKVCKQLFNTAEQMWEHALIHKELQRFKCSAKGCGYSSASREKLLQHKATLHPRNNKRTTTPNHMASAMSQTGLIPESSGMIQMMENQLLQPHGQQNPMDEFTLLGQQQHYSCEFDGCDSVFFSANELMKHVDRVHQKLQCPEVGCSRMFYTMGGLKSHQMAHLDEGEDGGPFACTVCLKLFAQAKDLKAHKAAKHGAGKWLECPLCQYSAKHRSSMNWHMKSRHGLDKVMTTRMGKNHTVYVDGQGNVVCSSRTDHSGAPDLSETSSGDGDTGIQASGHHDNKQRRDVCANDSPANVTMTTHGQGIEIVKNEPEELAVGDNNTIATTDGTVLGPSGGYTSELLYLDDYNNDSDQPLDFSMKKPTQASRSSPINNNNHLPVSSPPPNPSSTNSKEGEGLSSTPNKTPIGIVQPFIHMPSVSQGLYLPQLPLLGSGNHGNEGDVTPPLPQLVPMANPFIPGLVASPQQLLAMQSGGATGTPNNDPQFFSFKLNNNNNNGSRSGTPTTSKKASSGKKSNKSNSESNKNLNPTTYACSHCSMAFECAEIMWYHKLQEHKEITNIYCDTCTFETKDQSELQSHMLSTHGKEVGDNKSFMCFICNKGYSSKLGLNHHLMRHSEGGPPQFPCPYRGCDSVLHSRGALGNHVKRVHLKPSAKQTVIDESKQVFYCDYPRCDRSFRESKHLRVHRMTHTDEKPLKCHLCEYSCRQRNSMNWHMKSKHGLEKKVSLDGKTVYV